MNPDDPITLEPDPFWPDRYADERDRVLAAAGDDLLDVFHVGSTAIPDLPGKPALDVLAVYPDTASLQAAADALDRDGYEPERVDEDAALCLDWRAEYAVFHKLHTVDAPQWRPQVVFREYLRDHADARRTYADAKRAAADAHPDDPRAYTEAKSDVVRDLLEQARDAGYEARLPAFA